MVTATVYLLSDAFTQSVADYHHHNYIQALNGFYALAKQGDPRAEYNLGLMYANGNGVHQSTPKAKQWFEKSAHQGYGAAQYNVAKFYQLEAQNDPALYEKAKEWYEKATKAGVVQALNNLAILYMNGQGVDKDEQKAFTLFLEGANQQDHAAEFNVALLYGWGEKITHDKMKAYTYLKRALKAGKSQASGYLDKLCKESAWACAE
jgi:TPR repeat protein